MEGRSERVSIYLFDSFGNGASTICYPDMARYLVEETGAFNEAPPYI